MGRNVTVVPNNKIRFKGVRADVVEQAARIAKDCGGLAKPAF